MSARRVPFLVMALMLSFASPVAAFDNPEVAAGKVQWHRDLVAACESAQKSKKPVLLFQMLGRLDRKFC